MNWFHPPQLRVGEDTEEDARRATWLELFFDLIFVVAIAQLANNLHKDTTIAGFIGFVLLFIPVWWAWIGATFYANRFDVDDIGNRILTGLQMLAIAALAVNVHKGLSDSSIGFALSYVFIRVMLVFQYLRVAQTLPQARKMATWYAFGFAIAASFWFISTFIPLPYRLIFWLVGIVIDFVTPISAAHLQSKLLPNFEHLPERFGLFVIIVLGEAIVAVVNGVAEMQWQFMSVTFAVLGFCIAFSLWWIYFENVGGKALRAAGAAGQARVLQTWLYGHLPLVLGIAMAGIGVKHVIMSDPMMDLPDADRWLLCGSLALCFSALAVLHRTGVIFQCKARTKHRMGAAIVLLMVAIGGNGLPPLAIAVLATGISIFQVAQDLYQGHPDGWEAANEI
jgi:low temperature requirement protein LtrA